MTKDQNPDEEKFIALLEAIQPQPGETLRARVANATWASTTSGQRRPSLLGMGFLRRAMFPALAVIAVLIIFFAIPPFNGVAQRVANFFYRADQNSIPIALTAQPPSQDFPLTVAEAVAQAGFAVTQPGWVPEGFQFNGAAYDSDRESCLLDFYSPIPGKFLRLSQNPTSENRLDISSIGASAEVQTVDVHTPSGENVSGEYVVGAWRLPLMLDHLQTGQPDITATMQANWDPDAKIHMLRWQTNGFLHEIIHADQFLDTLSAEMLVKIAESMR
ncbi:MAG: hypothetical protein HC806_10115 [Anaerolineae bacterium]|nr:hypothetical protein [Anaerolineae bacterium]